MIKENQWNELGIFPDIAEETKARLMSISSIKSYPKGEILLKAKHKEDYIYILINGRVIIYNLTHTGRKKILFVFGSGRLLNESILSPEKVSSYCESISKVELLQIPRNYFIQCMSEDFELTRDILQRQERKIWRLGHQLKNTVGGMGIDRKLAAKLWKLARDYGIPREDKIEIDMNLSITFLADMLGVPRETASRSCRFLESQGLIRIGGKRILVCPEKLAAFYKRGIID